MATINRFYRPSQGRYVSQFVPKELPTNLLLQGLANKQGQYNKMADQLATDATWDVNALEGYDTEYKEGKKKELRGFVDEALSEEDLASGRFRQKYRKFISQFQEDEGLQKVQQAYALDQQFQERYKELKKKGATEAADELFYNYQARRHAYTTGKGFAGDIGLGDPLITEGVDIYDEAAKFFRDLKASGSEAVAFLEENPNIAFEQGWTGISSGRVREQFNNMLGQFMQSSAGKQLAMRYDMNSGMPDFKQAELSPEEYKKYQQDKMTYVANEFLKVGQTFVHGKSTIDGKHTAINKSREERAKLLETVGTNVAISAEGMLGEYNEWTNTPGTFNFMKGAPGFLQHKKEEAEETTRGILSNAMEYGVGFAAPGVDESMARWFGTAGERVGGVTAFVRPEADVSPEVARKYIAEYKYAVAEEAHINNMIMNMGKALSADTGRDVAIDPELTYDEIAKSVNTIDIGGGGVSFGAIPSSAGGDKAYEVDLGNETKRFGSLESAVQAKANYLAKQKGYTDYKISGSLQGVVAKSGDLNGIEANSIDMEKYFQQTAYTPVLAIGEDFRTSSTMENIVDSFTGSSLLQGQTIEWVSGDGVLKDTKRVGQFDPKKMNIVGISAETAPDGSLVLYADYNAGTMTYIDKKAKGSKEGDQDEYNSTFGGVTIKKDKPVKERYKITLDPANSQLLRQQLAHYAVQDPTGEAGKFYDRVTHQEIVRYTKNAATSYGEAEKLPILDVSTGQPAFQVSLTPYKPGPQGEATYKVKYYDAGGAYLFTEDASYTNAEFIDAFSKVQGIGTSQEEKDAYIEGILAGRNK